MKQALIFLVLVFFGSSAFPASSDPELITLPDQGVQSVVQILDRAKNNLKISMFHLSQKDLVNKIIALGVRGVHVQILLDHGVLDQTNAAAIADSIRNSAGGQNIEIRPSSAGFSLTHTKALLIDGQQLMISTINFSNAITYSRDYGVLSKDPVDIKEFGDVFDNDWQLSGTRGNTTPPLSSPNLVWSPVNSESKIVKLLTSAQNSIDIEIENLGSVEVQNALKAAMARGVSVRVVMSTCTEGKADRNWPFMDDLAQSGAAIRVMEGGRDPQHPYIHAKIILVDGKNFFLGSENFSRNSLEYAREVGIILASAAVMAPMRQTFNKDWQNAIDWKNSARQCAQ